MSTIYPFVITASRYGGTYEGGPFFGVLAYAVPDGATGSDIECIDWWIEWRDHPAVAVGNTVQEVYDKLVAQNATFDNSKYRSWPSEWTFS